MRQLSRQLRDSGLAALSRQPSDRISSVPTAARDCVSTATTPLCLNSLLMYHFNIMNCEVDTLKKKKKRPLFLDETERSIECVYFAIHDIEMMHWVRDM